MIDLIVLPVDVDGEADDKDEHCYPNSNRNSHRVTNYTAHRKRFHSTVSTPTKQNRVVNQETQLSLG